MKFIPVAVSRKIAEQGLLASENAPKVLFVGGVVGMVGSTVLACRATLKLSDTLEKTAHDLEMARSIPQEEYDSRGESRKKDVAIITMRGVGSIAKLYAPAVALGGVSIFALTKSHNLLNDRNLALTAAYAAVDGAYTRYRERVVERFGEEVDRELYYETEEVDVVDEDTGEVISTVRVTDAPGSRYARWYDSDSSPNWSPDPDVNMLILRSVQMWANDKLRARGHLFLNEVFSELGLKHTRDGGLVGWRWHKGSGDDYVDLGIWDKSENIDEFFSNGREGGILLDFNVDGPILDLIEEGS
jgi:hypothetical protein